MICGNCFKEFDEELGVCPYCGQIVRETESYFLAPGTILDGHYVIGNVIGHGGFGITYKAYDQTLDLIVAIKESYPQDFVARERDTSQVYLYNTHVVNEYQHIIQGFLNEARSVAMLKESKNIVRVLNYFEENNTAYMVMEYLQGVTLNQVLKTYHDEHKPFPIDTALQITSAICDALTVVHAGGIIHRDVKPGNIFLCEDETIKLIDFGASRISNENEAMDRTKVLTLAYAPPEQHSQLSKQAAYTDIYALGAVLYQMLTGRKLSSALDRLEKEDTVDPHTLRGEVSERLSNVVMRAIALKPELRFKTAEEFKQALMTDKQVRSVEAEIHMRAVKRMILSIVVVCLLLLSVYGGYAYYKNQAKVFAVYKTSINVAVPIPVHQSKKQYQKAFEAYMLKDFKKEYKQVSVHVKYVLEKDYHHYLVKALSSKDAPDLFDSSCLSQSDMKYCSDLKYTDSVIKKSYNYYFLNDVMGDAYTKRMPTLFSMPVIYENFEKNVGKAKTISSLKSLNDHYLMDRNLLATYALAFNSEAKVTDLDSYMNTMVKTVSPLYQTYHYTKNDDALISKKFKDENSTLQYYLTDSDHIDDISAQYHFCRITSNHLYGKFSHFYSISSKSSDNEKRAASRLMLSFLGASPQNYLSVTLREGLPLNKDIMDRKKEYLFRANASEFMNVKRNAENLNFLRDFDSSLDEANQKFAKALK